MSTGWIVTRKGACLMMDLGDETFGDWVPGRGWMYGSKFSSEFDNKVAKALGCTGNALLDDISPSDNLMAAIDGPETCADVELMLHAMAAKLNAEGVRL